jgi:transcriptional regulator with XRE-family HTH domain
MGSLFLLRPDERALQTGPDAMTVQKARKKKNGQLVGLRIRKLRKERALTQSELALRVGIQQSDLCRMETGEYKVALETLFKILAVFQMNVAEFFEEATPRHPSVDGEIVDLLQRLGDGKKRFASSDVQDHPARAKPAIAAPEMRVGLRTMGRDQGPDSARRPEGRTDPG